jgi:lipopolysaccharide transport system ATP-binding protein
MSDVVIRVENLSKKYILSHQHNEKYTALRDVLANGVKRLGKKILSPFTVDSSQDSQTHEDFYALRDVSFELKQGDRVGIIGRNGAGKSTLLKILSRITEPTSGRIEITGRVASLLEVGTGFHPELTGRENIFLNGAILGMGKAEIRRKFDEIVDFAEIEKFLDTPVKRYSSGMYVRLAFAVAAHLEPEILIVDEVLAVGDAQFQKKCLGKMGEVSKEGRTLMFVSHNMTALKSICDRVIWLNSGIIMDNGETDRVVSNYLQTGAHIILEQTWNNINEAPGNDHVRLHKVCITPDTSENDSAVNVATPLRMEFEFWNKLPDVQLNFSMHLYNADGLCILNSGSMPFKSMKGIIKGTCYIPGNFLNDGLFRVMIMIVKDSSVPLYYHDNVLAFEVHDIERLGKWYGKWPGVVRPNFDWKVEQRNP